MIRAKLDSPLRRPMLKTFIVASLWVSSVAQAKPLYITVPRTFSTQESATLDIAFSGREPVELRVLKPDNFSSFVQQQNNLRRAYTATSTIVNPGRYLARGLNHLHGPGTFLLRTLAPELRRELSGAIEVKEQHSKQLSRLSEGPEKLVAVPPGMTVVRNQWLNLDLGGADQDFVVPGFDEWTSHGGYQERQVQLQPLPAGVYVLQLVQGRIEGQVTLVVTDLSVQVKQTDRRALVRVAQAQKPVSGAKVSVVGGASGTTDAKGEAFVETKSAKALVVVEHGEDRAIIDTDFYSTLSATPDVFIYSDRPIYRPGDEIHFRGIVRQPSGFLAQLLGMKQRTLNVQMVGQSGSATAVHTPGEPPRQPWAVAKSTVTVDDFGCFNGTLSVPADADPGLVRVVAQIGGHEQQAEARVQAYVKPTFYLEVVGDGSEGITPGSTLSLKVRARRYAGGIPKDVSYEVFLYRMQLDTPAWIDDAGLGGQGSAVTYGSASTTEGMLSVPKRLYSTLSREIPYQEDPWKSAAKLDAEGEVSITVEVPALEPGEDKLNFRYALSIKARDPQKSEAVTSKSFFLATSDVMAQVVISTKALIHGEKAIAAVRGLSLGSKPMADVSGTLELALVQADGKRKTLMTKDITTGTDGVARVEVPTGEIGTVVARATLKDAKGRPAVAEGELFVLGDKGEAVTQVPALVAESLSGTLEPGQNGKLVAFLPPHWGPGGSERGPVWLTLAGRDIYRTELLEVSGQSLVKEVDIDANVGSAVYAQLSHATATGRFDERTVVYRVIPKARMLQVQVQAERDEVVPLGEQAITLRVSDGDGRPAKAQLSLSVVDKAIYALQSELRPQVLDFFYPLVRLNVANFYSLDFQGYGYGEELAAKFRRFDFAAVKPPTHVPSNKERDTAYWNAAITTDASGTARVAFVMPANATSWVATAVAADAAGRFGEAKSEFASRGVLTMSSALPAFLRSGDEAAASVRVARLEKALKGNAQLDILAALGGSLAGGVQQKQISLASRDEQVVPLQLKAQAPGVGEVVVTASGQASLKEYKRVAVRPASLDLPVRVSAFGGGELVLPASADRVRGAELVLMPSSVDVALASASDLLVYPFGCLEQLVATTVPNLALYRVLETTQALGQLDAQSQALMAEARSRSLQGLERILALQQKQGGFSLWSGMDKAEVGLTLIALDGLAYAVDAKLVDAARVQPSLTWVASQPSPSFALEATRAYVLARYQGEQAAAAVRAVAEKSAEGDLFAAAMVVLAAEQAKIITEPTIAKRLALLVERTKDEGQAQNVFVHAQDAFWSYPMRPIGIGAVLTHAASLGGYDINDARKRFVHALAGEAELSTFDRSTVLLHNLWLLQRDAAALTHGTPPHVTANAGALKLLPRGFGFAALLDAKATSVKVDSFEGVATLRATVDTPLASVKPEAHGMSLSRDYYVLRGDKKKRIEAGDSISTGDEIYVEFHIDAHKDDHASLRSAYYVVEDAVPAGFVALSEDKPYRAAPYNLALVPEALKRRIFASEKSEFFFEEPAFWSDSPRLFGYVMRAQFAGHFQVPPAQVTDMYAAQVFARTGASNFDVK